MRTHTNCVGTVRIVGTSTGSPKCFSFIFSLLAEIRRFRPCFVRTPQRSEVAKVTHALWGLFINVGNFMGTSVKIRFPLVLLLANYSLGQKVPNKLINLLIFRSHLKKKAPVPQCWCVFTFKFLLRRKLFKQASLLGQLKPNAIACTLQ